MFKTRRAGRCVFIALLAGGALLVGGRKVEAYTTQQCIGGDLYIDFWDDTTHAYQGYIRVRNSSQCIQNQYPS